MHKRTLAAFIAVALLLASACGGGGGNTPTDPSVKQYLLDFRLRMGTVEATPRKATLYFDGREVITVASPSGEHTAFLQKEVTAGPGKHIVRVVIVEQTKSPTLYLLTASVTPVGGVSTWVTNDQKTLATGEGFEYDLTF